MNPPTIGRYEILHEIGRGAMGRVFLARDPVIDRLVALKTFRGGEGEGNGGPRRLVREARSAALFSHPNVVTVYDVVEAEDGGVFIAMEYVRGTTLERRLAAGPLPVGEAAAIVEQVAAALDHIHARGLVHRDLKPANVLLAEDGAVKLTDFGVAQPGHPGATLDASLFATPQYMAPEQATGRPVDRRADVFALGVLLYEMLTGRRPFTGDSVAEVVHRVVYEPFRPLEAPTPAELTPVVARALDKDPAGRHPTAGALAAELRRVAASLGGEVGEATAVTRLLAPAVDPDAPTLRRPAEGARRPRRRVGRIVVGSAAVVALLTAGGLVVEWAVARRAAVAPPADFSYLPLLQEGRRLMDAGDPRAAAVLFGTAERFAPDAEKVRALRQEAERRAAEQGVARQLEEAREALAEKRYDEVFDTARALLESEAGHDEALAFLGEVEEALSRAARPPPGPATAERRPAAEASRPPPGRAILRVDLRSRAPKGVLIVYVDGTVQLRRPFAFVERRGFLGLLRRPLDSGRLEEAVELPAGKRELLIYLTRQNEAAQRLRLRGELPSGGERRLEIFLPADGPPRARLL